MTQSTTLVQESSCANVQFYKCVVSKGYCVNCGTCYLKEGDKTVHVCDDCNVEKECIIDSVYRDGSSKATCQTCNDAREKNSKLYNDWVWFYDTDQPDSEDAFHKLTERILDLPRDELRLVLNSLHSGFER